MMKEKYMKKKETEVIYKTQLHRGWEDVQLVGRKMWR